MPLSARFEGRLGLRGKILAIPILIRGDLRVVVRLDCLIGELVALRDRSRAPWSSYYTSFEFPKLNIDVALKLLTKTVARFKPDAKVSKWAVELHLRLRLLEKENKLKMRSTFLANLCLTDQVMALPNLIHESKQSLRIANVVVPSSDVRGKALVYLVLADLHFLNQK